MDKERQKLIDRIDAFCERHDMAQTRFGREAVNNPNLVERLRDGKPILDTSIRKINDFMRDYRSPTDGKPRPRHRETVAA